MKNVIILRSASNAGKTTFSKLFPVETTSICCANDYFEQEDGSYAFDATKLGAAHNACHLKFLHALNDESVTTIVVANTNTKKADYQFYVDAAEKSGAMVFFVVLERRHKNTNHHQVPIHVLERQSAAILNDMKLV